MENIYSKVNFYSYVKAAMNRAIQVYKASANSKINPFDIHLFYQGNYRKLNSFYSWHHSFIHIETSH